MAVLKDAVFKIGTGAHRAVFTATKGRLLGRLGGMPMLILTTTGRRSAKKRRTMLAAPIHDDGCVVVVASFGGDDRNPAWYLNLCAHPGVTVTMDGRDRTMRARLAGDDEKAELWPRVVEAYRGYAAYQNKTERDLPVVILEPVPGCEPAPAP